MNPLKSLTKWVVLAVSLLLLPAALTSCSSSLKPFKTCEEVECSGHGDCKIQGGKAVCVCDKGYRPDGLNCVKTCANDAECDDQNPCTDDSCDPATAAIRVLEGGKSS